MLRNICDAIAWLERLRAIRDSTSASRAVRPTSAPSWCAWGPPTRSSRWWGRFRDLPLSSRLLRTRLRLGAPSPRARWRGPVDSGPECSSDQIREEAASDSEHLRGGHLDEVVQEPGVTLQESHRVVEDDLGSGRRSPEGVRDSHLVGM